MDNSPENNDNNNNQNITNNLIEQQNCNFEEYYNHQNANANQFQGNNSIENNNNTCTSEVQTHEVAAIAALDASMADMEPLGGLFLDFSICKRLNLILSF